MASCWSPCVNLQRRKKEKKYRVIKKKHQRSEEIKRSRDQEIKNEQVQTGTYRNLLHNKIPLIGSVQQYWNPICLSLNDHKQIFAQLRWKKKFASSRCCCTSDLSKSHLKRWIASVFHSPTMSDEHICRVFLLMDSKTISRIYCFAMLLHSWVLVNI